MIKKCLISIYALLLTACASTHSVFSDYDRAHSFAAYKTFSWAHTPPLMIAGNLPISKVTQLEATQALADLLEVKGFAFVDDAEQADFLIALTLGARDDVKVYATGSGVYQNKENWL